MGGLSAIQSVCCAGHTIVFLATLCVGSAPYWVTYHQTTRFSHSKSNLGLLLTCESQTVRGHHHSSCRIVKWDDYSGELPVWVNVIRVLVAVSLYLMLVTLIVDIKSCCCQTSSRFVTQGMLLLHAGALLITSVVIFVINRQDLTDAFRETFGKTHRSTETLNIDWTFHLACAVAALTTLLGFLSFFARGTSASYLVKYHTYPKYNSMS